jgi:AcrR family transcriptional regulator
MEKQTPPKMVSRRARPAKAPLSRELIVSTGLEILEKEGLPGLSLRRIAAALDTGAASLYVYIANLNQLHALMLDQALAAVIPPGADGLPWRDRLKGLLLSYLRLLYERQGLAQLAMSTIASGPNSLRIWEALLGLLKQGGVEDVKAAWGVDLLTLYVTAIAAEQGNWRQNGQGLEGVREALDRVSAQEFPLLFALRETMLAGDGASRSHWALDVIIDGIVGNRP